MRKLINLAAMLFAISMCAAPLWAQTTGSITGTAVDQSGKPVAGATVQLLDEQSGHKYELKTNANGEFASIGLALGNYTATLIQNGNTLLELKNVPIKPGEQTPVKFDLSKVETGLTPEQRKQQENALKQHEKIKGLNASLAKSRELEGAGNYEEAVSVLQQATQVDPSQDLIWANLGDAQRGLAAHSTDAQAKIKDYQDAIQSYQKALAIKPNIAPYLAGMADAYAKSGQTEKAVEMYAAAAQADPPNAAIFYYNEGAVLTNIGKSDEAVAAFDKAIQIDPKRADAYYWKGMALVGKATLGKDNKMQAPPGTEEAFNKYLELEPNGKFASTAKDMLTSIGASVQTTYGKSKKK